MKMTASCVSSLYGLSADFGAQFSLIRVVLCRSAASRRPGPSKNSRLPTLIDINDHESVFAKKRSTLAAAIMLTSPGIPMNFQGQEMLETRDFGFRTPTPVDFNRAADPKFRGIVQMYRDLIALRRNLVGKTGGLTGPKPQCLPLG